MVTQPTRFSINKDGEIYDAHLCKKYANLEEILPILVELNDFCYDFEEEITRQTREINALIGDLDEDCYQ